MRLAVVTVLLLLAAGFATMDAQDDKKDDQKPKPGDTKKPKQLKAPKWKRKLKIEVDNRKAKIEAKSDFEEKTLDGKDKRKDDIKFAIEGSSDGLEVEMKYRYSAETHTESDKTRNKFSIDFKFVVQSIIEFVPTDITKGFQEGDTPVQEVALEKWSNMVRGTAMVSESQVDTFTIKGAKKDSSDVFTSTGHISTNTLNDMDYSSNYVKFGYNIDNFPYQRNNTVLALKTKVKGKFKQRTKTKSKTRSGKVEELVKLQNEGIEVLDQSPFGRFSWVPTAQAGGASVDIISSTKDDEKDGNRRYFFTFNTRAQPASINWDPDVGVGYPEDEVDQEKRGASGCSATHMVSFATLISLLAQLF